MLYWSTNTNTPQIQSAQLNDSSKVDTIATLAKGESPSCLTIDHSTRRLFWTDEYHVYVVNLNDKFRVKVAVLQVKQGLSLRPSGISFFNGKLYWANLETEKVEYAVTELTNELKNVKALSTIPGLTNDNNIVDVTVVDYSLQESINQCSARNGDCSHYCLSRQGNKFQCGCPLYMEIDYANVRLNSVCRGELIVFVICLINGVYFHSLSFELTLCVNEVRESGMLVNKMLFVYCQLSSTLAVTVIKCFAVHACTLVPPLSIGIVLQ